MDEFYVTLPSQVNLDLFPENCSSNWITVFDPPLMLDDDWMVGLSEIHLPRKWNNITSENNEFSITFGDVVRDTVSQTIPAGSKAFIDSNDITSTVLRDFYYKSRIPYEPIERDKAISFTMSGDPAMEFTRDIYFERLQICLELLSNQIVDGIKFEDGIKVDYKIVTVNEETIYIYELIFKEGWKMLFDANDIEPQHIQMSRIFGCVPCNFFKPMYKTIRVNKFDNLNGLIPEFKTKLSDHRIYIYNTKTFKEMELLKQRNVKIKTTRLTTQNCYIPHGSYTSPHHLVSAMMNALPKQALNYLAFTVSDAGYLNIISEFLSSYVS